MSANAVGVIRPRRDGSTSGWDRPEVPLPDASLLSNPQVSHLVAYVAATVKDTAYRAGYDAAEADMAARWTLTHAKVAASLRLPTQDQLAERRGERHLQVVR